MAGSRTGSRRRARKRALDILYEADLKQRPVLEVLDKHLAGTQPPEEFAVELVRGFDRHQAEVDVLIDTNARDWSLSRMPYVDRNILRLGVLEILHEPEVPTAVAINEAVELAKTLSTDDSGRFVNGVLARIAGEAAQD